MAWGQHFPQIPCVYEAVSPGVLLGVLKHSCAPGEPLMDDY